MNTEEFRIHGKKTVDYICNYIKTVGERDVAPTLDPGYLKKLIPSKLHSVAVDIKYILAIM